jgi:CheY-like chemotaxis protein
VKQARAVLSTDTFDVLISDISLPDGQGWDILETTDAKLRSIALSGYTADKDKQAALSHGFTAFLTKPFATAELIDTIERA